VNAFEDVAAFPLCWPDGWLRTKSRKYAQFKQTVATASANLMSELDRMGARRVILSTNVPVKRDGTPYANQRPVGGDDAAAVYFERKGKPMCMACDQYFGLENNIQALAKSIEALRGLERWGSTDLLDRAFTGFAALPAPDAPKPWYAVMGLEASASRQEVEAKYRELAYALHPDNCDTGSHEAFVELQAAYRSAKEVLNA
jgi:hypothetical protein